MRVFRFAPSPSGLLHIGHIPGPLISYSLAKSVHGRFVLRIEDTDQKRNQMDKVQNLIEDLIWVGIAYDDGPAGEKPNDFFQSQRLSFYKKYVQQLIDEGKAYKAYETPEERELQVKEQRKKGQLPIYMGNHANLTAEERENFEKEGRQPVVRLKVQKNKDIEFEDKVYGKIKVNTNAIGDFVIQRSNGFPMYNMAVVVDDYLMGITDVVRGFDHLNNTPKQILVYEALGWPLPTFGHHPSLLAEHEKGKLSKRKGAKPLAQFRGEGYLPEAIFNYIIVTFCSFDFKTKEEEILSIENIYSLMSFDKITKTNPKFSSQKLEWFNGQYIRKLSPTQLEERVLTWLQQNAKELAIFKSDFDERVIDEMLLNIEQLKSALPLIHTRITKFEDILLQLKFLFISPESKSLDIEATKHEREEFDKAREELYNTISSLPLPWKQEEWENSIRQLGDRLGWKHGDLFMALRLLIVGERYSPPLLESMQILGKEECLKRIRQSA